MPTGALAHLLAEARVSLLLTQSRLVRGLAGYDGQVEVLDPAFSLPRKVHQRTWQLLSQQIIWLI